MTRRPPILHVESVAVIGDHRLELRFNDGTTRKVDVRPLLDGPVFERLQDPAEFARVTLDEDCGTIRWPHGADLAPEALAALPELD